MESNTITRDHVAVPLPRLPKRSAYQISKRIFDLCFAVIGLILFAPFALIIAIAIKVTDRGPIFYRQVRVGRHGDRFSILKFRSMVVDAEKLGPSVTQGEDRRITRIGRLLRKTKLDEFPQLWNVLMGEMSFVGPRPEVPRYVEMYSTEQRQILEFRPGITDLATLVFRDEETLLKNASNVEEFYVQHCIPRKFKLNLEYARRASLLEDAMIILETLCPYWLGVACGYVVMLASSLWLGYQLRFDFQVPSAELAHMKRLGLLIVPLQLFFLFRGRQFAGLLSYFDVVEMKRLAFGLSQAAAVQFLVWYVSQGDLMPGRSIIVLNTVLAFLLLVGTRTFFKNMRETRHARVNRKRNAVSGTLKVGIVGAGELGGWLARQFNTVGRGKRRVVVFFDDDPDKWNLRLCDIPVAGMPECLLNGAWSEQLDEVILAIPGAPSERQQQILGILTNANIRARTMPSLEELFTEV